MAPGTNARAVMFNFQAIQTLSLGGNLTLENNTFFNYLNSDNQDFYYFADNSNGSWTIENRLDHQPETSRSTTWVRANRAISSNVTGIGHARASSTSTTSPISAPRRCLSMT